MRLRKRDAMCHNLHLWWTEQLPPEQLVLQISLWLFRLGADGDQLRCSTSIDCLRRVASLGMSQEAAADFFQHVNIAAGPIVCRDGPTHHCEA
jgi:hypothetical protein